MIALPITCALLLCAQLNNTHPIQPVTIADAIAIVQPPPEDLPTALFNKVDLQDLLKDPKCTGIRFYNALSTAEPTSYTVIAIGTDGDGKELGGGRAYYMYNGLVDGKITSKKLNSTKASDACVRLTNSGKICSCATLERRDIEALLAMDCHGIQTMEEAVGEDTGFRTTTISIIGNEAKVVGEAPDNTKICGEPCPAACGPIENYLKTK